ncbi:uncharacterized protein LOC118644113 isoform X2 [Monomorium pharaonis]|uniref:uncharacterized protein LOC118644113 isoform X2 n=1 Tax=Monomorium pharaonis TaxID=307658 RepID=UPI001746D101|nr:uncharacterized protein LOC118644113 isoform X2 [Monomorium pharaonis]
MTDSNTADTYYTINRNLLLCIGLWPYQSFGFRCVLITMMTIILISGVVFQFTTFVTREYSMDLLLKILAYSMPWLTYLLRYNILCLNTKKMQSLIERVHIDWNEINNARELEIIKKYSAIGRLITLVTTLSIYLSTFSFILIQLLSNFVLDITKAVNESRLRQFPAEIECFVDQQKYFTPLLLYLFFVVLCSLTVLIAVETLFMLYTQHACGLFEVANCRIEQTLHRGMVQDVISVAEKNSIIYQGIISAVDIHRKAIEFIEMSKENFKWVFFTALPLTVLSLSINLYRLSRQITTKEHQETVTTLLFVMGQFGYLFFCNYLGQKVIDHSGDIFHKTYNVQWYMAPLKAQKLLLLVMQRSMRYCTITIGGLFIPSLEGFATNHAQCKK